LNLKGLAEGDGCYQVVAGEDKEEETVEEFRVSVTTGDMYMLYQHRISEHHGFKRRTASQALIAKQVTSPKGSGPSIQEVDVLFAVARSRVVGSSIAKQVILILRH
jgi:hypothetical protein